MTGQCKSSSNFDLSNALAGCWMFSLILDQTNISWITVWLAEDIRFEMLQLFFDY